MGDMYSELMRAAVGEIKAEAMKPSRVIQVPEPYTPPDTFAYSKLGAVMKLVKSLEWSSDRNAAQEYPGAATHRAQCCPRCSGLDPRTPLSVMRLFPTAAGHSEDCTLRVALDTLQEMMLRA